MRIVPAHLVPAALMATEGARTSDRDHERAVVRPECFEDVTEVVRVLKARRSVVLELDRLDDTQRRRAFDFVTGVAYALDTNLTGLAETKHVFLLEPGGGVQTRHELLRPSSTPDPEPRETRAGTTASADAPVRSSTQARTDTPARTEESKLCVLCDLRPADVAFESPLDMVIRRDGSRMWSPPALVCGHCRATTRQWRFALAWCPECERWGRRNVASPCGVVYG